MCNVPKVAPILVINFADFELWCSFHLMKIIYFFLLEPLPVTKGDIETQNVVQTSPYSNSGKMKKMATFPVNIFRGRAENDGRGAFFTQPLSPGPNRVKYQVSCFLFI